MKNYILLLTLAVFCWQSCKNDAKEGVKEITDPTANNADMIRNPASAEEVGDTNLLARMIFEEAVFNFGEVKEGTIVTHSFKFTNTGKVPLIIQNARSTCGCTVPDWPKDPIAPGGTGEINARFNTEGKHLAQSKVITVKANTYPSESKVTVTGIVNEK